MGRKYNQVIKVAVCGTICSGKSTLVKALEQNEHFAVVVSQRANPNKLSAFFVARIVTS